MKLLIFSADNYLGIARLPKALKNAKFMVAALCHEDNYLAKTRFLDKRFSTDSSKGIAALVEDLSKATKEWKPRLIIPGDHKAIRLLHRIMALDSEGQLKSISPEVISAVKQSLGNTEHLNEIINKAKFRLAAEKLGLNVPFQERVENAKGALAFAAMHGYPVVLKKNYSVSGRGVAICASKQELKRTLGEWLPNRMRSRAKKFVVELMRNSLETAWIDAEAELNIQQYIAGPIGMYAGVASAGKKLGGIAFCVERLHPEPTGPSSVVRSYMNPELEKAISTLLQYFGATGFLSFDFLLQKDTGKVYVIECNARPIPVTHLGARFGTDLCAALYAELSGSPPPPSASTFSEQSIALFPQELSRDKNSSFLRECFHDVPWDDPLLLASYLESVGMSLPNLQALAAASKGRS